MNFDFALVLVIAVAVTGLFSFYDVLFLAPKRKAAVAAAEERAEISDDTREKLSRQPILMEYSRSFFPVLFIVLILRSFLVEPFQIPSGSMLPTLKIGDFILVNKYHYGIRLPVAGTKVIPLNDPQRGDVMVFKYPEDPRINYIKRVVGVPGDKIRYANKKLFVNGKQVPQEFVANLKFENPPKILVKEDLFGVEHEIYVEPFRDPKWPEWEVPEGNYFVLGDNRDNSRDSRYWNFVPDELVVGKAFAVWLHWESWLSLPSFSNNGLIK